MGQAEPALSDVVVKKPCGDKVKRSKFIQVQLLFCSLSRGIDLHMGEKTMDGQFSEVIFLLLKMSREGLS